MLPLSRHASILLATTTLGWNVDEEYIIRRVVSALSFCMDNSLAHCRKENKIIPVLVNEEVIVNEGGRRKEERLTRETGVFVGQER